jgi:nucleotide-binding universal stress UspA family protein
MTYRNVLCATDLSRGGAVALRQADAMARFHRARLGVVLVMPDPLGPHAIVPQRYGDSYAKLPSVQTEAMQALEQHLSDALGGQREQAELFVDYGIPYAAIVERAEAAGTDLLVVGAHGRSGLETILLGSVTAHVLGHARCSVLVARESPAEGEVMAATDFSAPARRAAVAASEEARSRGRNLTLVHCLDVTTPAAVVPIALGIPSVPPPAAVVSPEQRHQEYEQAEARLQDTARDLELRGETVVSEGNPAPEIARLAQKRGAALVVVGGVGRTGLARMLLGSVAEEVSRRAPCSVLVVR